MNSLAQFSLAGKRALVTGSSRGLGFAIASALAGAGAEVVLNGRNQEALGEAAERLVNAGAAGTRAVAFDVTSPESIEDAIDWIEGTLGPIDILVNNAGIQHRARLDEFPIEAFDRVIDTNLRSVFLVGSAVARHMLKRKSGRIINICSMISAVARTSIAPYAASKAGVSTLTRGMAADWAPHGLNINAIAPGYFYTELNAALVANAEFTAWVNQRTPMGRWGDPEELGGAAILLASEAGRFINGHVLYVDGGFTATV